MKFGWNGALPAPGIRTIRDMRGVLANPRCPASGPLYYMYRDLARSAADRRWLADQQLRYDITVIPPFDLCGEYVKTKGHYHPADPAGIGYPELLRCDGREGTVPHPVTYLSTMSSSSVRRPGPGLSSRRGMAISPSTRYRMPRSFLQTSSPPRLRVSMASMRPCTVRHTMS